MRLATLLFIAFLSVSAVAEIPEKSSPSYILVSDIISEDVPSGQVMLKGTVHYAPDPSGVLIATPGQERKTKSDEQGNFSLVLSPSDTSVFCFKAGTREILIPNYDFKAGHEVTIDFYLTGDDEMLEVDKPVIYLYSDEPITAHVEFDFDGEVTFTYPAYNEGWDVAVSASGNLADLNNHVETPYLFWEGEMDVFDFGEDDGKIKGFLIHTDTAVAFLEHVLQQMGLTTKESADFITFWAPQIIDQKYALIQFNIDEAFMEKISRLNVTPKPDQLKRVYMVFSSLDTDQIDVEVIKQQFQSFDRNGFTVVEWGGSKIPRSAIINSL